MKKFRSDAQVIQIAVTADHGTDYLYRLYSDGVVTVQERGRVYREEQEVE